MADPVSNFHKIISGFCAGSGELQIMERAPYHCATQLLNASWYRWGAINICVGLRQHDVAESPGRVSLLWLVYVVENLLNSRTEYNAKYKSTFCGITENFLLLILVCGFNFSDGLSYFRLLVFQMSFAKFHRFLRRMIDHRFLVSVS